MADGRFNIKNVNKRDAFVGLLLLVILAVLAYTFLKPNLPKQNITIPTPRPEERVEEKFKLDIPDGVEKAELLDVSGGTGSGIATRDEILVDLADPEPGKFYQAWLGDGNEKLVSLGKMRIAKGGWIIEYNDAGYIGYNKVVVSLETRFDSNLETKILEGSFK